MVLPDHVGIPLGEEYGGTTYFLVETHYDNPGFHAGVVDNSGLRVFYTDRLREHDTGNVGIGLNAYKLHIIPPRQKAFRSVGVCSSNCTEQVTNEFVRLEFS